jgi:hypothetical protein
MMIFRAVGGLGNQLFIVAAAMAASSHWGDKFQIDTRGSAKGIDRGGPHLLASDLESLYINGMQFRNSSKEKFAFKLLDTLASIENRISVHVGFDAKHGMSFSSNSTGFNQLVFQKKKLYTRGYFQSYRYLQYLRDQDIGFSLQLARPSRKFTELSAQLNFEESTVVHIRRGDYLKHSDSFGILSPGYYQQGLEKQRTLGKINSVLVFSDDETTITPIIKTGFWADYGARVVSTKDLDPAETLMLMAQSKRFVIANSSFSWWAAALNEKNDVVYPEKWFKSAPTPRDLFFPHWIAQESSWE